MMRLRIYFRRVNSYLRGVPRREHDITGIGPRYKQETVQHCATKREADPFRGNGRNYLADEFGGVAPCGYQRRKHESILYAIGSVSKALEDDSVVGVRVAD